MSGHSIPVIGIVGSIGSGKSALARELAARLGGMHLDADRFGHELLLDRSVIEAIRAAFGPSVLNGDGQVDRRALARQVFGESTAQGQGRKRLETILHPRIRAAITKRIDEEAARGRVSIVLLDAAVLLEAGWEGDCDALLCVDAPREQRLERVASRGWDEDELARREATQLSLEEKRRRADVVIENSGDLADAVDVAITWLTRKYSQLRSSVLENTA
jgi:dephospho-CoA kinase